MPLGRNDGGSRRARIVRVLAAVATVAACLALVPPGDSAGADETGPFKSVGTLPLGNTVPLLPDAATGRLIALNDTHIEAWDPVTLTKVASSPLAPYRLMGNNTGNTLVYAWAPGQARLYVVLYTLSDTTKGTPHLGVVDPATLRVESVRKIDPSPFPPGITPKGMSYYAPENRLYLLGDEFQPFSQHGAYRVLLTELDAATAKPTWATPYALGALCQRMLGFTNQAAVHRLAGTSKVFFGCGGGGVAVVRQPAVPGVAVVDIADPANPTTKRVAISGAWSGGESMYDPVAGRLVLISQGAAQPSQAAWVFDERQEAVIGVMNAGSRNIWNSGVDPVGGRLYVGLDDEVLTATHHGRRMPQATSARKMNPSSGRITPVPFARRIVIPGGLKDGEVVKLHVFENRLPDFVAPPVADPDAATVDVAEAPGRTRTAFGADAKAFGARVHQVAGVNGVVQNFVGPGDFWAPVREEGGVNDGDRNLYFARAVRARLSTNEASASAATADGDATTQADYKTLTRNAWPYRHAECADLRSGRDDGTAPEAAVACDATAGVVEASAAHEHNNELVMGGDEVRPVVSFGHSTSSTKLIRDPKLGVVVEAKAESRDILVAGVARFGRVSSVARTAAAGRPGTTAASYERSFENVTMPGFSCTSDCDPKAVIDHLHVVAPQVVAELPKFELVRSPRGAQGSALRDPWEHEQDVVMNNDGETDLEIPAIRFMYIFDNSTRARAILEFAGTMASSAYSISRLPDFGDDDDAPPVSDIADVFAGSNLQATPSVEVAAVDAAPAVASRSRAGSEGIGGLFRRLGNGLRLLLTGRRAVLLNIALWSLLWLPAFLISRRRHLLRLVGSPR